MSALARLCLSEGKNVSGSDVKKTAITEALEAEGVKMTYGQTGENVPEGVELVIYSEAVEKNNPERVAFKKAGAQMINYFDALGLFLNDYYLIAVAGSHGKTTTTAMLTEIMEAADLDPTAIIGSLRTKTNSNFRAGKSKYAIVEACEFRRDFLSLKPDILVITNIEYEHVDYYKNLEDVQKAFKELAEQVAEDGVVVSNTDDSHIVAALEGIDNVTKIDYTQYFDPLFEDLAAPGMHNRMNAAAAIAVASYLKIDIYLAREALKNFEGTWRRFQRKGEYKGAQVIDDYAHHPTEIKATLSTVRELFPEARIRAVFQPHSYSRTETLFDEFTAELAKADEVLLLPIYRARDKAEQTVSSEKLQVAITGTNPAAKYFDTKEAVESYLEGTTTAGDVIVVMGAGDITELASDLVK